MFLDLLFKLIKLGSGGGIEPPTLVTQPFASLKATRLRNRLQCPPKPPSTIYSLTSTMSIVILPLWYQAAEIVTAKIDSSIQQFSSLLANLLASPRILPSINMGSFGDSI